MSKAGINWNKLYADTQSILDKYNLDIDANAIGKKFRSWQDANDRNRQGALGKCQRSSFWMSPAARLTEEEIARLLEILKTSEIP